jgi:hypothetical protein
MKTRFDVEDQFMGCWGILEELDVVIQSYRDNAIDKGDTIELLEAIRILYDRKFRMCMGTFEQAIKDYNE